MMSASLSINTFFPILCCCPRSILLQPSLNRSHFNRKFQSNLRNVTFYVGKCSRIFVHFYQLAFFFNQDAKKQVSSITALCQVMTGSVNNTSAEIQMCQNLIDVTGLTLREMGEAGQRTSRSVLLQNEFLRKVYKNIEETKHTQKLSVHFHLFCFFIKQSSVRGH